LVELELSTKMLCYNSTGIYYANIVLDFVLCLRYVWYIIHNVSVIGSAPAVWSLSA